MFVYSLQGWPGWVGNCGWLNTNKNFNALKNSSELKNDANEVFKHRQKRAHK